MLKGEQANALGFRRFVVLLWDEALSTADHIAKVAKVLRSEPATFCYFGKIKPRVVFFVHQNMTQFLSWKGFKAL